MFILWLTIASRKRVNYVPAARRQLARARAVWGRLSKVIAKESVPAPVAGMFYQAVVAAVLLYGSESWVLPKAQFRALEGFHVECARRLTGMRPRKVRPNRCMCPKSAEVPKKDNLKSLRYYIHPKTPTHRLRQCLVPSRPGGVQGGGGGLKGSPLRKYWWDLPMEAPKEEDDGLSGLGAFFGRNEGAGGGDVGDSSRWDRRRS